MNKNELKKILKPLIKECIKEVIVESGVLSKVVSEVAQGLGNNTPIREQRNEATASAEKEFVQEAAQEHRSQANTKIQEYKKRFAEQVSKENFGGIDVFEGTTPLSSAGSPGSTPAGPLANREANDPGIDISGLVGRNSRTWKALINE